MIDLRLFYAIFVPQEVRQALTEAQRAVKSFRGWKTVRPEQMHVTLLFLGEMAAQRLHELRSIGQKVANTVSPFSARVAGTGYFPEGGSPRVWFAKVKSDTLEVLAAALQQELPQAASETFKAHITLARKKSPAPRVGPVVFDLEFAVSEMALVESVIDETGSRYRLLERFSLKGA